MRKDIPMVLMEGRIVDSPWTPSDAKGLTGAFIISGPRGPLKIIATEARLDRKTTQGWDHVSVSCPDRVPTWEEMCFVKDLFWRADETVIQFHPPESQYVNNHPYVLHLWCDTKRGHRLPPKCLV